MNSAGPTSRAAANTRSQWGRSGSRSMCLCRFSIMTMAASIIAPIAIAIPPSSVPRATSALRACNRNSAQTIPTMIDSSISVRHNVLIEPWIRFERS